MKALEVYRGSDGLATKQYYASLCKAGTIGVIAMNLFRAQKCSNRAKKYRGGIRGVGSYRGMAYERKNYSMHELCRVLGEHGEALGIRWGWKKDPKTLFEGKESWVLYVDLPQGQVSFHSPENAGGPAYSGDWDQQKASEPRILQFCDEVMASIASRRGQGVLL